MLWLLAIGLRASGARFGELRNTTTCAVSGSGQLGTEQGSSQRGDPGQTFFAIDVPALARNHTVRQMMITDPNDQQAPAATEQNPLALKLKQAGGLVEQFFVQSSAANHHDVTEYTRLVMAGCLLGKPNSEIALAATTIARRNAEINQSREDKAKAKAAFITTARQPALAPLSETGQDLRTYGDTYCTSALKADGRHARGINPRVKPLETRSLDASAQISAFGKLKLAICAPIGTPRVRPHGPVFRSVLSRDLIPQLG
jgi:hypothetical protein